MSESRSQTFSLWPALLTRRFITLGSPALDEFQPSPEHAQKLEINLQTIEDLLNDGADVHEERLFSNRGEIQHTSPLFYACERRDWPLIRALIEGGAKLDFISRGGTSVLHEAVKVGNSRLVKLLLECGAPSAQAIDRGPWQGCTALHLAAIECDLDMVQLLLECGFNSAITTPHGWTAFDIALLGGQIELTGQLLARSSSESPVSDAILIEAFTQQENERFARHLIDYGVRHSSEQLHQFYLQCLSRVATQMSTSITQGATHVSHLIEELKKLLLSYISEDCTIIWDRKFCVACSSFQELDMHSLVQEFKHSPDLESLMLSAEQSGCALCKVLLATIRSRNYGVLPSSGGGISLKLYRSKSESDVALKIFHGDKWDFCDLVQLDSHLNQVINNTADTDADDASLPWSIAIAKTWIDHCDRNHARCKPTAEDPLLPSRVIDLGHEPFNPVLHETPSGQRGRYAALSYVWGTTENKSSTTAVNLPKRLVKLDLEELPKTIQDAVILTRGLGVRYLWVDAICIVQDSQADFTREILHMGNIYSKATLTIAACDSKNATDGFLNKRDWFCTPYLPLDIHLPAGLRREKNASPLSRLTTRKLDEGLDLMKRDSVQHILNTRGWALQERTLSSRMLNAYTHELTFNCLELTYSLAEPIGVKDFRQHGPLMARDKVLITRALRGDPHHDFGDMSRRHRVFAQWTRMVTDYTQRSLSEPRDKIIALAGMQQRIAELLQDEPIAGLWKAPELFVLSLLWSVQPSWGDLSNNPRMRANGTILRRAKLTFCPSWSWAKHESPVRYPHETPPELTQRTFDLAVVSWDGLRVVQRDIEITGHVLVKAEVFHAPDFFVDSNTPKSERLTKGSHEDVAWLREAGQISNQKRTGDVDHDVEKHFLVVYKLSWDTREAPKVSQNICFMLVTSIGRNSAFLPTKVYLLCVEESPADGESGLKCFRRVGLAEAHDMPEWRERGTKITAKLF